MKKITYFYFKNCSYCKKADKFIEELLQENPDFKNIEITKIEERENPDIVANYDYYYVPCFYFNDTEKVLEGDLSKSDIENMLIRALSE